MVFHNSEQLTHAVSTQSWSLLIYFFFSVHDNLILVCLAEVESAIKPQHLISIGNILVVQPCLIYWSYSCLYFFSLCWYTQLIYFIVNSIIYTHTHTYVYIYFHKYSCPFLAENLIYLPVYYREEFKKQFTNIYKIFIAHKNMIIKMMTLKTLMYWVTFPNFILILSLEGIRSV